ncbi:hypothetical protein PVAND_011079 [Polypedilum vanderplanki]|uniref:Galectin n=1 Tax=Polypedilum vanderplanki TaxID=319348 RepID=A0A9J6CHJ2_POLVA|nr:hypothetical protein PVAND_011079 [Polypedilum vanderplanki]
MATIPVYNPSVPFLGLIPGGLKPSLMIRLKGKMTSKKGRCHIDFINSPALNIGQDIIFHMSIRMDEKCIVRNSFQNNKWKGEERYGAFRISFKDPFEIIILAELEFYKIAINGVHLGVFRHRLPLHLVQYINVTGDVTVDHILFEQDMKSAQEHARLGHIISTNLNSSSNIHGRVISTSAVPSHTTRAITVTQMPVYSQYMGNTSSSIHASQSTTGTQVYPYQSEAPIYASQQDHMANGSSAPIYASQSSTSSSLYPSISNNMFDSQVHHAPSAPPIYSSYEPPPSYDSQNNQTWLSTPFFEIAKRPGRIVFKTSTKESSLKF